MHADIDTDVLFAAHGRPHDGRTETSGDHTIGAGPWEVMTPATVHHQVFTVVRLREGYSLAEVDAFLSRVEHSLAALWRENKELGERLDSARRAGADVVEAARLQAEQIITEAYAQAEQVQLEAVAAAEVLVERTCSAHREALEDQIDQLEATVGEHGRQLQHGLTVQLAQLRALIERRGAVPSSIATTQPWPPAGEPGSADQAPL